MIGALEMPGVVAIVVMFCAWVFKGPWVPPFNGE
jgi:hypothetical protein